MSSSRASFRPRNRTHISYNSCIGRRVLYHWATREPPSLNLVPQNKWVIWLLPTSCSVYAGVKHIVSFHFGGSIGMEYLLFSFVLKFFLIIAFSLNLVMGCQLALIKGKYTHIIYIYTHTYTLLLLLLSHFSRVRLCATPETAAHQAPPSLGFSRQEHWSGLPFPSPMHESEKWKWSRSVVSDS